MAEDESQTQQTEEQTQEPETTEAAGSGFLSVKKEHGVAVITIDNPPINAMSPAVLNEIQSTLDSLAEDDGAGVLVITGAGSNAFCAGADLKELGEQGPEKAAELIKLGQTTFQAIHTYAKPVIAAVNNLALGGGMELALACDMRISSDRARFGQPEVWIGLIPAWGGSTRLGRLVGISKAKELILTGQMINAQEAYRIGLVNKVVPDGEEVRAAIDIGRQIVTKGAPLAVRAAKHTINEALDEDDIAEGLEFEMEAMTKLAASKDLAEGIKAFIEKRPPQFKGE